MFSMNPGPQRSSRGFALMALVAVVGCAAPPAPSTSPAPAAAPAPTSVPARPAAAPAPAPAAAAAPVATTNFVAPAPVKFEDAIARAGQQLFAQAAPQLGAESRVLVIDPLIDANTGAQTVSTVKMGEQLESIAKSRNARWAVRP